MYWRVRKITPDMILKQYSIHIGLIISLFANFLLIATRPTIPKVSVDLQQAIDVFVRQVTQNLLDTSYISYAQATTDLLDGELAPPVVNMLRQQGLIAKSDEDLRAQLKELTDQRQVAAVKIESVNLLGMDKQNLTVVEVKGKVAVHSSEDAGPSAPVNFLFRYSIGAKSDPDKGGPELKNGKPVLMVADFKDLSGAQQQQQQ